MSQFTDYAENKIADFVRGQGLSLPGSWFFAFGTAASDSSFTEIVVTGYARVALARSTANFNNTQADATTAVSSGTSHATANTNAISFGSPSGGAVSATHIGIFDAGSGGNCWAWLPLDNAISVGGSVPVAIGVGLFSVTLGLSSGCSDYLANKLVDLIFRGVAYTWPATIYLAAYTVAPTNAGGGIEVAAIDYARVAVVPSLTALSGTQGAGTTSASSGTGGAISNNNPVLYATPTSAWGTIVAEAFRDSATVGNLLLFGSLGAPLTVNAGSPLTHSAGSIVISIA